MKMDVHRLVADLTIAGGNRVLSLSVPRTGEHQESQDTIEQSI